MTNIEMSDFDLESCSSCFCDSLEVHVGRPSVS